MRKHKWAIAYSLCLIAFTTYISLNTFVLSSTYRTDATEMNLGMFDEMETNPEAFDETETQNNTSDQDESAADHESESSRMKKFFGEFGSRSKPDSTSEDNSDSTGDSDSKSSSKKRPSGFNKPSSGKRPSDNSGSDNSNMNESTPKNSDNTEKSNNTEENKNSEKSNNTKNGNQAKNNNLTIVENGKTGSYSDDNITITLQEYEYEGSAVYVADVKLSSAVYLKTAFADNSYGKNVTDKTSVIADENDAILAINGDYYGAREKGCVIRNGVAYRENNGNTDILCIYADGTFKIVSPGEATSEQLVSEGVWQAFSFGPALVENGEICVTGNEMRSISSENPRTAVGMIDRLHYVFVVSDGRTNKSEGLTLTELAGLMKSLGAETAYNLDGGGSSTMVFNGDIINNPTTTGSIKERSVSDIVYIR